MKYQVAIVEDETLATDTLRSYFKRYQERSGHEFLLDIFPDGENFLIHYKPIYDLVLMDIQMPHMNGMDAAAKLREMDHAVTLIFVTNMAQYAVKGYEVNAFDYIVKPVSYAGFSLKLQRALNQLAVKKDQEIIVSHDDLIRRVPSSQIRYIEISGHDMIIHTTKENIEAYGNLKQVEAKLNSAIFARCNNCYLVNLNYVRAIQGQLVYVGDDVLQMSRPRRKAFIQALNNYLGEGL